MWSRWPSVTESYVNATHPSHLVSRTKRKLQKYRDETGLLVAARRLAGIPDSGWVEPQRQA
ncbi:MAG: hypothetical protein ABI231_04015 [Candidatus Tumulicola sp.]